MTDKRRPSYMDGIYDAEALTPKQVDGEPIKDADDLTIKDMNGDYSRMRPANKPLARLHIVFQDGSVDTLYYAHLDAKSSYRAGRFVFTFIGAKHWELAVDGCGPDFWRIYDYVSLARWPYLREASGSATKFDPAPEATVFTKIKLTDVTPKDG